MLVKLGARQLGEAPVHVVELGCVRQLIAIAEAVGQESQNLQLIFRAERGRRRRRFPLPFLPKPTELSDLREKLPKVRLGNLRLLPLFELGFESDKRIGIGKRIARQFTIGEQVGYSGLQVFGVLGLVRGFGEDKAP